VITERLMAVGSWSVELHNAPIEVRRRFDWYGNVFVTASRVRDTALTFAGLSAVAKYAGIIKKRNIGEGQFGGPGLLGYLQSGKGHAGQLYTAPGPAPTFPATFTQIIQAWLTGDEKANGLSYGSAFSAYATTVDQMIADDMWPPLKPRLDDAAAMTGNEYVVRPDGTVDYGRPTSLFQDNPTVIVAPGVDGVDDVRALKLTRWSVNQDINDYRNFALVISSDGTTRNQNTTAVGSLMPLYGWGRADDIQMIGRVTLPSTDTSDLQGAGAAACAETAEVAYSFECAVDEFCIPRLLTPGDWVYVFDPDNDMTGTTQVIHQGRNLFPVSLRCFGYSWPLQSGMGVYVYSNTDGAITDVTDYVKWDNGDTRLELGSAPKPVNIAAASRLKN
jgi:hypothetical protein